MSIKSKKILITGASGYIGGRLLEELLQNEYNVSSMVRRPKQFLQKFTINHDCRYGNTFDPKSLDKALFGIDIAFYLIHSLNDQKDFIQKEIESVKNFIQSAKKNNVKRIIYLGGLFQESEDLSDHLKSRKIVGDIIRASGITNITLRASIIIGSGSISFEMIRNLTETLPVMITPKWVRVKAQPIGVADVLEYLIKSIDINVSGSNIFEIGGYDQISYLDIIKEYAIQRNLKRLIIPVPGLSLKTSSFWLSFFTPLYAKIGAKLIDSIKNATTVTDSETTAKYFSIKPISMKEAIKRAIQKEDQQFTNTHWATAYSVSNYENKWLESKTGNKLIYTKKISINKSIEHCFEPIQGIGGENGWYFFTFIWKLRGFVDILFGGPGYRGRKHPHIIFEGDFLDWWRVEQLDSPNLLRLYAEMKTPGRAWLEFELKKQSQSCTDLYITAIFEPNGIMGRLYWYSLYPAHFFIFNGLLRKIKGIIEQKKSK